MTIDGGGVGKERGGDHLLGPSAGGDGMDVDQRGAEFRWEMHEVRFCLMGQLLHQAVRWSQLFPERYGWKVVEGRVVGLGKEVHTDRHFVPPFVWMSVWMDGYKRNMGEVGMCSMQ